MGDAERRAPTGQHEHLFVWATVVDQRVGLITLGVADLARARAFYQALGWTTAVGVVFFQAHMIVASGAGSSSPGTLEDSALGRTPSYNVPRERPVIAEAEAAGATTPAR